MSSLSFRHLLAAKQIGQVDIAALLKRADYYRLASNEQLLDEKPCAGKILASLFFEPSTRTRFSFESAMLKLGGQLVTLEQGAASSVKKGESLEDMGCVVSNYADIVAMRHPQIGSVDRFASGASVPVINAGDGANQHPTQALLDIYTIFCEQSRLDNLKIGIVGDLKYGRTVHSLLSLLSLYPNNSIKLISHPSLALEQEKQQPLVQAGLDLKVTSDLTSAIEDLDVLYVTRVQQERFANLDVYQQVKDLYQITPDLVANVRDNMIVMHPLPRVNEIDPAVDKLPCAKYFKQTAYGLYLRMALLSLMLNPYIA